MSDRSPRNTRLAGHELLHEGRRSVTTVYHIGRIEE